MKQYLLQYLDEDGVQWTSFSSIKERTDFIKFHESEIYEKFEPLQEIDKEEMRGIEDLVIDKESYIKLMSIEGYETCEYFTDKSLKFTNLKGELPKDTFLSLVINRKLGKKKYILDNVVISFENEDSCFIESVFLKEEEHYKEHDYTVVIENNHLNVKKETSLTDSLSGKCSFGGCLELVHFIRKNIKL